AAPRWRAIVVVVTTPTFFCGRCGNDHKRRCRGRRQLGRLGLLGLLGLEWRRPGRRGRYEGAAGRRECGGDAMRHCEGAAGRGECGGDAMKGLLVAGTTSEAGKSAVTAGICRWLARRGVKVAPFKAQNMSLNSVVTRDGAEIGR